MVRRESPGNLGSEILSPVDSWYVDWPYLPFLGWDIAGLAMFVFLVCGLAVFACLLSWSVDWHGI